MKDDQTPATKADIQEFKDDLRSELQDFRHTMDRRFSRVDDYIDKILHILVNRDEEVREALKEHERRIKRVEKRVGIAAN